MHRGAIYNIVSLDRESADSTKIVTASGDRKIRIIDLKKKGLATGYIKRFRVRD